MNTFSIHSIVSPPPKFFLLNISKFHPPDTRFHIPFITIKFTITANKYHENNVFTVQLMNKRLAEHFWFFVPHIYTLKHMANIIK